MTSKKTQNQSKCLHLNPYPEVVLGVKSGDYVCSDFRKLPLVGSGKQKIETRR